MYEKKTKKGNVVITMLTFIGYSDILTIIRTKLKFLKNLHQLKQKKKPKTKQ